MYATSRLQPFSPRLDDHQFDFDLVGDLPRNDRASAKNRAKIIRQLEELLLELPSRCS